MTRTLICMPTYNEIENISKIIPAILEVAPEVHILVIDDSSPDGTGTFADQMALEDERIIVLHRTEKQGLGPAYVAGFKWGIEHNYDRLVEMDADFSHQPHHLPQLLAQLDTYDVVIGSRYIAGGGTKDWGLIRRLISRGGGVYARLILGLDIQDLTAGFVAWRADVLKKIDLSTVEASGYVFQIELKYRAFLHKFRILEVPITFPDRVHGTSKMSYNIAAEALWRVWHIRFKR